VHCDGARIWNAAVANRVEVAQLVRHVDTMAVCFTKGLGAPFGACVAGPSEVVDRAGRLAVRLCGHLRQAGVMAAAALTALEPANIARLSTDHDHASALAEALMPHPRATVAAATNFVMITVPQGRSNDLAGMCALDGLLVDPVDPHTVRLVVHRDVDGDDVHLAASIIARHLDALWPSPDVS
jgi:threonine aldolase